MKRKTDSEGANHSNGLPEAKKRALTDETAVARFRKGLFDAAELAKYTKSYANSAP
jgi:hypothetical protein